jgi:membrane associated rhomboid family serine protease
MIPLKDRNPTRRFAWVTLAVIAACVAIYFFVEPTGRATLVQRTDTEQVDDAVWTIRHAAIPCELVEHRHITVPEVIATFRDHDPNACAPVPPPAPPADPGKNIYLAALYSMFLHGGLLHLGGNMLFLWVFGNNIEDRMGRLNYVLFYVAGGLVALAAHVMLQPYSTVPVVGASGAIAAVMGAYLVLFPNVKILSIVPVFILGVLAEVRAKWLLAFWLLTQFLISPATGIASGAHIGGFLFGMVVALLWRNQLLADDGPQAWDWEQRRSWA